MWKEVKDKQQWNMLVASQAHAQFLQSWEWGEFQKSVGRKVIRLSWKDQVLIQLIGMPLKFGKFYWYCGRGPVEIEASEKRAALSALNKELKSSGALFLRTDPLSGDFWKVFSKESIHSVQPQCVQVIDITMPKDEYFKKKLYTKTRYNIRLAERKGVEIRPGEINNFLNLNKQTTKRNQFVSHPNFYYIAMVKRLAQNRAQWKACSIKIWEAHYKNTVIASNIVIYFGDTVAYAHGASSSKYRNVMAPHLLQWKIIQDGIKHGYKYHDLGGVNPSQKEHKAYRQSWEGISRFKQGFGGEIICYPHSFDLIYRAFWYSLYKSFKKIRGVFQA